MQEVRKFGFLLFGGVGSVGFCLWVWLVCCWFCRCAGLFAVVVFCQSAVAVLGFVLVVSAVFVCLVNESSAGADADLFVYK